MNTWLWLHPTIGGCVLMNMSNVVYLFGSKDGTTTLVLSNNREMIVKENEEDIINGLEHKKGF